MEEKEHVSRKSFELDLPVQKRRIIVPISRATIIPPLHDIVSELDIPNLEIPVPAGESLMPFQIQAIKAMLNFMQLKRMKGVYNGYDPGTGKSCMGIVLAANVLKCKRILVVCPSGMRGTIEEEIRKWDIDKHPLPIHVLYSARGALRPIKAKWVVVSYALLLKHNVFKDLYDIDWDFMIFDEAKEIKSINSKRTQLALELWNRTRRGIWQDGTPVTRCALDLFPACHTLLPDQFMDETEFAEEYCLKKSVPWGFKKWEYFSGQNLEQLSKIIRSNFFIRKKKEEVLLDLPEITYQKIILDCGKFDKELTEEQENFILQAIKEGRDPTQCAKPSDKKHISERRMEAGLKTLKHGHEFIGNLLEGNIPVMVIAYHTDVINQLMRIFKAYDPAKIDGSVVGNKKDLERDRFNSGATNLIVLQIKSAVGINLQHRCSTAVYIETSYDPTQIQQSLARIVRKGQKNAINAYFFVAKGSVDEAVFRINKEKLEMIEQVVLSTDE